MVVESIRQVSGVGKSNETYAQFQSVFHPTILKICVRNPEWKRTHTLRINIEI